ncbi:maleylacetate reductase [Rhodococcoides fascians]|uniref:maleylacetate reductase n=1 Tax=Rhodococcoides fascians TaxID=1828 RepID=UPI00055C5891|nr:maleylacetate reductase [Rhodococcus sp. 15-1189-1-1a]OZF15467.1 maleylacetate reductase [Rhodococcus sp. 14-2686-1-2]
MEPFIYDALPMRVRFGVGSLQHLSDELDALGVSKAVVITTPQQEDLGEEVNKLLGDAGAGVYPHAAMHVPAATANEAVDYISRAGADAVICPGGGSTTGLGKAIALKTDLPIIAVPTTYAGSEMTPIWGITDGGVKRTGRDRRVLPRTVVYDPDLTVGLPVNVSVTSGLNAMAHSVEALYAPDSSPIISLMAEEGVQKMLTALPAIAADPADIEARSDALYAAWLCGAALGATTMGLHHKLCHILGGTFDLPHADTHAIVLPYVMAFNLTAAPAALRALQRATGSADPALAVSRTARTLGVPSSLAEIGMPESGLKDVIEQALNTPYSNPREVTEPDLVALLSAAWAGTEPIEVLR